MSNQCEYCETIVHDDKVEHPLAAYKRKDYSLHYICNPCYHEFAEAAKLEMHDDLMDRMWPNINGSN